MTSDTVEFTRCFEGDSSLLSKVEDWRLVLDQNCRKSFKKIRIRPKQMRTLSGEMSLLIDKRNHLKKESCQNDLIEAIEYKIADLEATENRNSVLKHFELMSNNPEYVNMQNVWKILNKLCPNYLPTLPSAKRNPKGILVTDHRELKELLSVEYQNRLRTRAIRPGLEKITFLRKEIFEMNLKLSKSRTSDDWNMIDLENALADLKNNKSRDFEGYINEIFKAGTIGADLKHSMLIMFNQLKKESVIPEFMNFANVTTIPKKGSKFELKNERGIFRVSVVRSILMRLIYNSKYEIIDSLMSDCQMGARKGKSCRNNIWMINGIIHESLHGKNQKPILLQIYDYSQMFDSIYLPEALNDIFENGLNDDHLPLIWNANKNIYMSVKTPGGLTDRQTLENIVLQGDTWGPLLASVQVDNIAKHVEKANLGIHCKGSLPISLLGLMDDVIGIAEVGMKSHQMNVILNLKSAEKGLQFGTKKCKTMLVGKKNSQFIDNSLKVDSWSENVNDDDYKVTDLFEGQVEMERVEKYKYLGFVISSKGNNMENITAVRNKSIGVISKIFDKLKSLNLKQYYFECSAIFFNVILRGSILYACETYYGLTESQLRTIERIEENYLRKVFGTSKGCPIVQLYLEFGVWPARFEIMKRRCLFLKTILNENENSKMYKFFQLQLENPVKGDWVSGVLKDLQVLEIEKSFCEIKLMTIQTFKDLLRRKIKQQALKYLESLRGIKGREIKYSELKLAEYLQPIYAKISIDERRKIFAMRNKMIQEVEDNFGNHDKICICKETESMKHIYNCKTLNSSEIRYDYEDIYEEDVKKQIEIVRRFEESMKHRTNTKENSRRSFLS